MQVPGGAQKQEQQLQNLKQQLEQVLQSKKELQRKLEDLEVAKEEINEIEDEDLYKSAGSFLISTNKEKAMKDIEERLENAGTKLDRYENKEDQLKQKLQKLQKEAKSKQQGSLGR